jgi:probable rRNA maturation factor
MFTFEILNHPESFTIDVSRVEEIFRLVSHVPESPRHSEEWRIHARTFLDPSQTQDDGASQNGIINIAFLSDEEIHELNHVHRGIDSTTDVLSFHYFEDFSSIDDTDVAWEVIMSESRILSQSLEYGHSASEEFEILLIHSLLHLLGYDHKEDADFEVMFQLERDIGEQMWLNMTR